MTPADTGRPRPSAAGLALSARLCDAEDTGAGADLIARLALAVSLEGTFPILSSESRPEMWARLLRDDPHLTHDIRAALRMMEQADES